LKFWNFEIKEPRTENKKNPNKTRKETLLILISSPSRPPPPSPCLALFQFYSKVLQGP
jgi:hypothetical protein